MCHDNKKVCAVSQKVSRSAVQRFAWENNCVVRVCVMCVCSHFVLTPKISDSPSKKISGSYNIFVGLGLCYL